MISENKDKPIGITYYLFASSDGEVFSGGGEMPRDAYIEEIGQSFVDAVKGLTDENPHRTIILTLETEPAGPASKWTFYEYDDTLRTKVLRRISSFFYSAGYWFSRRAKNEKRIFIVSTKKLQDENLK